MTATSVTFSPKVASDWDPQKPLTTTKLNQLYDNTTNVHERLGGDYTSNTKNHTHNGVDSALLEVGANMLRNGSLENGTDGWTTTIYTGGTVALNTANKMHGIQCLAFTSTVLANGAGKAVSDEYIPVSVGEKIGVAALVKSSVANVSSRAEIIWYDSAKAEISSTTFTNTNTPTTKYVIGGVAFAPATAAYARAVVHGCVPASGTTTGTIYADGCTLIRSTIIAPPVAAGTGRCLEPPGGSNNSSSPIETVNARISQAGIYRIGFYLQLSVGPTGPAYARIYRNGVAYGTTRSAGPGGAYFTEDLYFDDGDTMQVFLWSQYGSGDTASLSAVWVGIAAASSLIYGMLKENIGVR